MFNTRCGLAMAGVLLTSVLSAHGQSTLPADEEKVLLQFRPREGEERVLRLHAIQQATRVGLKDKSHFRQAITMDNRYLVLPTAGDGRARLQITILATAFHRVADGKVLASYDSKKSPKIEAADPVSDDTDFFAMLPGFSFVTQMNADGTIGEIEGKEAIADQMIEKMKVGKESVKYIRPALISMLDGNAFKNFGNIFASFPNREVAIGDAWPKRDVVTHDWNLIYDGALTLAKRNEGQSTLHLKSVIKPDPNRSPEAQVYPVRGTQTGYYFVDEASGWTKRALLEQRWTARVNEFGHFVSPDTKDSRPLYMKMTFHIGAPGS